MPPEPTILAFDTSAAHCAAALLSGDAIAAERFERLGRGQAERLMVMLEAMLAAADTAWNDIQVLAVGIGPGNFTGTRISVAAARGLALGLGIPAIGVSTFEIMRPPDGDRREASELVSIEAPGGQAYVQLFRNGSPQNDARMIDPFEPPAGLGLAAGSVVTGYMANEIASRFGARATPAILTEIGPRIARRARWHLINGTKRPARPSPLYVRAPDAAPPKQAAPAILP